MAGRDCIICPACNKEFSIGDFPFCPHGMVRGGIVRDEIPGGFVQEHFGHEPETFYSWSAMRKRADALGLQPFVRRLERITEGDYIDAYTLESARALLSRAGGRATPEAPVRCETVETSVRTVTRWSDVA